MKTLERKHTRGRGSNPRSRANLRPPTRTWWVYSRGAGIGWSREFGPFFQGEANEVAAKFEAMNYTGLKPMFVASTDIPSMSFCPGAYA